LELSALAKTLTRVDLEPIDRLEEKVKLLVDTVERLRSEQARLGEENRRLAGELDMAHARLNEAEGTGAELTSLREEREVIRGRVTEMLEQLDALNL
jgi:FtsZ-binding cell division protein ZapB